jgi:DNA-binding transcriptional LysR family regulator
LNETQKANPGLRAENSPLRTSQVIQDVLSGLLDYGVCFSPHGHPSLERKVLHTGTLKLVVSKKHPLVKLVQNKTFKLDHLNQYPAIIHKFSPGIDYCENHPVFEEFVIMPKVSQYFHSDDLCVQAIQGHEAWAMIPDIVESKYSSALFSLPLPRSWSATYDICAIYRKTMKNRGVFLHFDEKMKEMLS